MKAVRRYAQGTDVPVSKTRGEIEALLRKHGASQILSGIDVKARDGFVAFTLHQRQYRIPLLARVVPGFRNGEQLERERWRALLLIVKAKLEFVASGMTTVETEFLGHLVLPDGTTVADQIRPRLADAYASGRMAPLLPEWPRELPP